LSDLRLCARKGCGESVKKPTNRYCSRACCAADPERIARLRHRAPLIPLHSEPPLREAGLPWPSELPAGNAEELFLEGQQAREECPAGLSRLAV
jgi:hypothetical protein